MRWRSRSRLVLIAVVMFGAAAALYSQALGAKEMFYDPADRALGVNSPSPQTRLRPVPALDRFPSFGHVGVHFWFENGNRSRFSETSASTTREALTLHLRSNTAGFLTVLSMDGVGAVLTERTNPKYAGLKIARDQEYVVPGEVEFSTGEHPKRLMIVFSRSQTEQVSTASGAQRKLESVLRGGRWSVVRESEDQTPDEIGTYIVDPVGGPVVAEIVLRSN